MRPAEIGKTLSKPIILTEAQWAVLQTRLSKDNHSSVMLIREKMKVVLGFTVRRHQEWVLDPGANWRRPVSSIRLDFYSEPKRTMFMLKYSEYLDKSGKTEPELY